MYLVLTIPNCFFSSHKFLTEFLEVGGVLTVLEILGLKQTKEVCILLQMMVTSMNLIFNLCNLILLCRKIKLKL